MIDPDQNFSNDFNYNSEYYCNDRPEYWVRYSNPTSVTNVHYKMNSYGYRCDEFDLNSEFPVVFMGCSNTLGLGLPVEDTWAHKTISNIRTKVNKNVPYWNLARNGSSLDLQFWNLNKHIDQLKPRLIILLVPPIYRRNIVLQNHIHSFLVNENHKAENNLPLELQKSKGLLVDESFVLHEMYKYFMLIDALCSKYNTQLLFQYCDLYEGDSDWNFFRSCQSKYTKSRHLTTLWCSVDKQMHLDNARDRMHRGPISNAAFASELWNELSPYVDYLNK
jgi:hypothetical protein